MDWEGRSLTAVLSSPPNLAEPVEFGIVAAANPELHRQIMALW